MCAACGRVGLGPTIGGVDAAAPGVDARATVLRAYVTCDGTFGKLTHYDVDEIAGRLVDDLAPVYADHDPEATVISADGAWLYAGNFSSGNVSTFQIDAHGHLTAGATTACAANLLSPGRRFASIRPVACSPLASRSSAFSGRADHDARSGHPVRSAAVPQERATRARWFATSRSSAVARWSSPRTGRSRR